MLAQGSGKSIGAEERGAHEDRCASQLLSYFHVRPQIIKEDHFSEGYLTGRLYFREMPPLALARPDSDERGIDELQNSQRRQELHAPVVVGVE